MSIVLISLNLSNYEFAIFTFFQNSPQNESFYYKNAIVIQIHKNILLKLMIFILFDIKDDDSAIEKLMKTRKSIVSSLRHHVITIVPSCYCIFIASSCKHFIVTVLSLYCHRKIERGIGSCRMYQTLTTI